MEFTLINPPSAPPHAITWSFKGNREVTIVTSFGESEDPTVDYVGRISVNKTTASLELRDLTENDTGLYTVSISIILGGVPQQETTLLRVFGMYFLYIH